MKYIVLFVVVAVVLWLLRVERPQNQAAKTATGKAKQGQSRTEAMATCPSCGVHFPATDGAQGRLALYCSDKHRHSAET